MIFGSRLFITTLCLFCYPQKVICQNICYDDKFSVTSGISPHRFYVGADYFLGSQFVVRFESESENYRNPTSPNIPKPRLGSQVHWFYSNGISLRKFLRTSNKFNEGIYLSKNEDVVFRKSRNQVLYLSSVFSTVSLGWSQVILEYIYLNLEYEIVGISYNVNERKLGGVAFYNGYIEPSVGITWYL